MDAARGSSFAFLRRSFDWPQAAGEVRVRCLQALPLGAALLVAPGLLASAVDLPKRLALEALLVVGWTALVAEGLERGAVRLRRTPLEAALVLFVAASLASALGSTNPGLALESVGLGVAWAALATLAVSGAPLDAHPRVLAALLLAGGIEGVYGILQYAGIDFLPWASSWGSRCFGTIGNPIFFAEFLEPLFVAAVALLVAERDDERKDLLALLVLVEFLALVFAQTRSAWLGSVAGLAVAGVVLRLRVRGGRALLEENRTWLLAFGGFAAAVVLTISSTTVFGKNALPLKDRVRDMFDRKGWTVQHRLVLWRAAALMARERPVLGVGPDHFRSRFPLIQAAFRPAYAKRGFSFPPKEMKAHDDYLQHAAEHGVVGLGLWLWACVIVLRLGWLAAAAPAVEEGALAAGLTGGCVALMVDAGFNFPFRIIPAAAVFWMFAGLLAVRAGGGSERALLASPLASVSLPWRRSAAAALAALAAGWVAATVVTQVRADRAYGRGEAYLQSGFFEMAEGAFAECLAVRPQDPLAHYQRGVALEKSSTYDWTGHSWDKALHEFEEARALGLNDELLFAHLAMLFERKSHFARSVAYGELAEQVYPESNDHAANLAFWYATRVQNLAGALALADRAVGAVPQHPLYHWTRGLVLEKLGRHRDAFKELQAAVPLLANIVNGAGYWPDLSRDLERVRKLAGIPAPRPALPSTNLRTF